MVTIADLSNSTIALISDMLYGTEPAWIYNHLISVPVCEIEMAGPNFYVRLATPADAQAFAQRYDGTSAGEKSHTYKKEISVKVIPMTDAPKAADVRLRLTNFLHTEKTMPHTKTVSVRGLPVNHPQRAVMAMCEDNFDGWNTNDDYGGLTEDSKPGYLRIEITDSKVLVRFTSEEAASAFVGQHNGAYWKNATTYAECVDDAELDGIMKGKKKSDGKDAKLFIGAVKPNATKETIRALFAPHQPNDIVMPPGTRFAFVFMLEDAAVKFLADFPPDKGKLHDGWNYRVKRADDKKKR